MDQLFCGARSDVEMWEQAMLRQSIHPDHGQALSSYKRFNMSLKRDVNSGTTTTRRRFGGWWRF